MDWLRSTTTSAAGPTLLAWQQQSHTRLGRWRFMRAWRRRVPYVGLLEPELIELRASLCRVAMPLRHTPAIGGLCELAAGMVTEVTIPPAMQWSARGMAIEYLRPAQSDVRAIARLDKSEWTEAERVGVPVSVIDAADTEVARAVVTMAVSVVKR